MALNQDQITEAITTELEGQIQKLYDTNNVKYQITGTAGSEVVFPQGKPTMVSDGPYYYPTFEAFNKKVTKDSDGNYQIGSSLLTDQLQTLYSDMGYALSEEDQKKQNVSMNKYNQGINDLYSTWLSGFGKNSAIYKKYGEETTAPWVTQQQNSSTLQPSNMLEMMSNSLMWVSFKAAQNPKIAYFATVLSQSHCFEVHNVITE